MLTRKRRTSCALGYGLVFFLGSACARRDVPSPRELEQRLLAGTLDLQTLKSIPSERAGDYLDVERSLREGQAIPGTNEDEVEKVTRKFGRTVIDMSQLPRQSAIMDSGARPWSAWWYPNFESTLFRSATQDAPLQKYDRLRDYLYLYRRQPPPSRASQLEEEHFNGSALRWEGLCHAWAFASLLSPEPQISRTYYLNSPQGLVFSPTDLKALLLKTFEAIPDKALEIYGQKFTGEFDGWLHPDPFPDQFHRFVEQILGQYHRAFIMDHDPGVEIWNVPVFKAKYQMSAVPDRPDAVKVRMWLTTASPLDKHEIGRSGMKETIREYQYVLLGTRSGNFLEVTSGIWIVGDNGLDSRRSHPDYLIDIPDPKRVHRESFNRAIEPAIVDAIIKGETIR